MTLNAVALYEGIVSPRHYKLLNKKRVSSPVKISLVPLYSIGDSIALGYLPEIGKVHIAEDTTYLTWNFHFC